MEVGDLVKRRNNGDLALVLKIGGKHRTKRRVKIMRLSCGNTQCVWDYEYEVING